MPIATRGKRHLRPGSETILGIDPGIGALGYGVVERRGNDLRFCEAGVIRTDRRRAHYFRLAELFRDVTRLTQRIRPHRAGVERLFFVQNVTTGMAVSEARGIALLALAQARVPLLELTPSEVKQALTGVGSADKRQVRDMVCRLLHLAEPPRPDDVSDALAIAISTAHQRLRP